MMKNLRAALLALMAVAPSAADAAIVVHAGGYHPSYSGGAGARFHGHARIVRTRTYTYSYISWSAPGVTVVGTPAVVDLAFGVSQSIDQGDLIPGAVVGARRATVADAVVLADGVDEDGLTIAPQTILVRVSPQGATIPLWCSVRRMPVLHGAYTDCLMDAHGTGRMDEYWRGYLADKSAPFSILGVSKMREIKAVGYRKAAPDERPAVDIGYRFCPAAKEAKGAPYRFDLSMRDQDGGWIESSDACPYGAWIDPNNRSVEDVDGMKVQIQPGPLPHYRLLEARDIGELERAPLTPGEVARGNPPTASQALAPAAAMSSASMALPAAPRPLTTNVQSAPDLPVRSPQSSSASAGSGRVINIVVGTGGDVQEIREVQR